MSKEQIANVLRHATKGDSPCGCGRLHMFVSLVVPADDVELAREAMPETHWESPGAFDACHWCSDYRYQHYNGGCKLCGVKPWERGVYRCRGFVEEGELSSNEAELLGGSPR